MVENDKLKIAREALQKLAHPKGAWNNDHHIYLENVITESIEIAKKALRDIQEPFMP